jgi:hypothetical protein
MVFVTCLPGQRQLYRQPSSTNHKFSFSSHRWRVRLFDGGDVPKEGWVPASILEIKNTEEAIFGDKVDDAAYRRK